MEKREIKKKEIFEAINPPILGKFIVTFFCTSVVYLFSYFHSKDIISQTTLITSVIGVGFFLISYMSFLEEKFITKKNEELEGKMFEGLLPFNERTLKAEQMIEWLKTINSYERNLKKHPNVTSKLFHNFENSMERISHKKIPICKRIEYIERINKNIKERKKNNPEKTLYLTYLNFSYGQWSPKRWNDYKPLETLIESKMEAKKAGMRLITAIVKDADVDDNHVTLKHSVISSTFKCSSKEQQGKNDYQFAIFLKFRENINMDELLDKRKLNVERENIDFENSVLFWERPTLLGESFNGEMSYNDDDIWDFVRDFKHTLLNCTEHCAMN